MTLVEGCSKFGKASASRHFLFSLLSQPSYAAKHDVTMFPDVTVRLSTSLTTCSTFQRAHGATSLGKVLKECCCRVTSFGKVSLSSLRVNEHELECLPASILGVGDRGFQVS